MRHNTTGPSQCQHVAADIDVNAANAHAQIAQCAHHILETASAGGVLDLEALVDSADDLAELVRCARAAGGHHQLPTSWLQMWRDGALLPVIEGGDDDDDHWDAIQSMIACACLLAIVPRPDVSMFFDEEEDLEGRVHIRWEGNAASEDVRRHVGRALDCTACRVNLLRRLPSGRVAEVLARLKHDFGLALSAPSNLWDYALSEWEAHHIFDTVFVGGRTMTDILSLLEGDPRCVLPDVTKRDLQSWTQASIPHELAANESVWHVPNALHAAGYALLGRVSAFTAVHQPDAPQEH